MSCYLFLEKIWITFALRVRGICQFFKKKHDLPPWDSHGQVTMKTAECSDTFLMGLTFKTPTFHWRVVYNLILPCHSLCLGVPVQGCLEQTRPNSCLGKLLSLDAQGTCAVKCLYYTANHTSAIWPPGNHGLSCGWCVPVSHPATLHVGFG